MLEYWDRMQPERSLALLSADEDRRPSEVKVCKKLRELARILADCMPYREMLSFVQRLEVTLRPGFDIF
jgi:hypothetical protein